MFRVQASTMEEAIQITLQVEYSYKQARSPATVRQSNPVPDGMPDGGSGNGIPMGQFPWIWEWPSRTTFAASAGPGERRTPAGAALPTGEFLSLHEKRAGGASHGDIAPDRLCSLEEEKGIVARNRGRYPDALRGSKCNGLVSIRLADGTVVEVPQVHMDLVVKFEDFDRKEPFLVLGMPWLEKHAPWIDWRGMVIGASRPPRSERALVNHVPSSGRSWGAHEGRQGAAASKMFIGVVGTDGDSEGERTDQVPGAGVPDGTYHVGNSGP
ncbi:hypothetical protein ON010_g11092 [Phytophthora cinnamomi]|nr:hypothetical protein ON010_g11092 [Phytophthora cinnamomi]